MPNESTDFNYSINQSEKKKNFLIISVAAITMVVFVISVAFLYFTLVDNSSSETGDLETEKNSELSREIGSSAGKIPYAPIDEKNVTSLSLNKSGGVLSTTLSKNVKVFLVVPEGEIVQDAIISLIPYKTLPSQKNHGGLSSEYGFGLQVKIESIQTKIGGYLVFDVKGGKATSEAVTKDGYKNRCDPRFKWFNPFICSRGNEVPARQLVDKNSTIITPIHAEKYNNLVFTNNTIPLGIDGLIVTKINKGDVYIPQKLDKDLVFDLVKKTLGRYGNDSQRLEAAALAKEWEIDLDKDQLEVLADSNSLTYQEHVKAYHLFKGYREQAKDFLAKNKSKVTNNDSEEDKRNKVNSEYESIISKLRESEEEVSKILIEDTLVDIEKFDGDVMVEAAVALGVASDLGLISAVGVAVSTEVSLEKQFNQETNIGEALRELEAAIAIRQGSPVKNNSIKKSGVDLVSGVSNDPDSSVENILDASSLAQILGLDDLTNQLVEKIKRQFENKLKENLGKKEFIELAILAQRFGFKDIENAFIKIAETAKKKDCDLIKNNLDNFSVNECK